MGEVVVEGVSYVPAADLARELGVTRQTIWRWRTEGKIPAGHRFRNGRVLFSSTEADAVRRFARQIEPLDRTPAGQLGLFES